MVEILTFQTEKVMPLSGISWDFEKYTFPILSSRSHYNPLSQVTPIHEVSNACYLVRIVRFKMRDLLLFTEKWRKRVREQIAAEASQFCVLTSVTHTQ